MAREREGERKRDRERNSLIVRPVTLSAVQVTVPQSLRESVEKIPTTCALYSYARHVVTRDGTSVRANRAFELRV